MANAVVVTLHVAHLVSPVAAMVARRSRSDGGCQRGKADECGGDGQDQVLGLHGVLSRFGMDASAKRMHLLNARKRGADDAGASRRPGANSGLRIGGEPCAEIGSLERGII